MCKHRKILVNNVYVCVKCGLMVSDSGKFIGFDKELPNYLMDKGKCNK